MTFLKATLFLVLLVLLISLYPAQTAGQLHVYSGMISLSLSSCPPGFTENTSFDGVYLLGTTHAHGDVGTTGGSNTTSSVSAGTPAGTNSAPTFTGSQGTTSSVSGGTPAGTNAASATSGNCAATNIAAGTGSTTACKATAPNLTVTAQTFTGSSLAGHTHTLTPAGTNSAPTFTGSALSGHTHTITPSFIKVIFCSAN